MACDGVIWIGLIQESSQWRICENTLIEFVVPQNAVIKFVLSHFNLSTNECTYNFI